MTRRYDAQKEPAAVPPSGHRLRGWLTDQIAALNPGAFAVIMATGIISNAMFLTGHRALSDALFALNIAAYCALVIFTALRLWRFRPALWADLIDPRRVFSFFTLVAGTGVLGMSISLRARRVAILFDSDAVHQSPGNAPSAQLMSRIASCFGNPVSRLASCQGSRSSQGSFVLFFSDRDLQKIIIIR